MCALLKAGVCVAGICTCGSDTGIDQGIAAHSRSFSGLFRAASDPEKLVAKSEGVLVPAALAALLDTQGCDGAQEFEHQAQLVISL